MAEETALPLMRLLTLLLVLAPAFLLGCDSADTDPTGIGDLTLTLNPFDETNQILIRTEAEYSEMCALGVEVKTGDEAIRIEVTGSTQARVCSRAFGPWSATVRLPETGIENYEVVLRKDGETDRYRINRPSDERPLALTGSGSFSRVVVAE